MFVVRGQAVAGNPALASGFPTLIAERKLAGLYWEKNYERFSSNV